MHSCSRHFSFAPCLVWSQGRVFIWLLLSCSVCNTRTARSQGAREFTGVWTSASKKMLKKQFCWISWHHRRSSYSMILIDSHVDLTASCHEFFLYFCMCVLDCGCDEDSDDRDYWNREHMVAFDMAGWNRMVCGQPRISCAYLGLNWRCGLWWNLPLIWASRTGIIRPTLVY